MVPLDSTDMVSCSLLIVPEAVSCTDKTKLSNLASPLAFYHRRRDPDGTIFVNFCMVVNGWLCYKIA